MKNLLFKNTSFFQTALALIFAILWASCDIINPSQTTTSGVYVANQGNFGQNNGTVTVYNPTTQLIAQDAIPNIKTLIQSVVFAQNTGFLVANTGDRVDLFAEEEVGERAVAITATSTSALDIEWMVTDQLGTPRIVVNKTGSVA